MANRKIFLFRVNIAVGEGDDDDVDAAAASSAAAAAAPAAAFKACSNIWPTDPVISTRDLLGRNSISVV